MFKRALGLTEATLIGLGDAIGATIFVVIGKAAAMAGPAVVLSAIGGMCLSLLVATCYAELGSALPIAGGGYTFAQKTIGGKPAFIAGWLMWLARVVFGALSAMGFAFALNALLETFAISYDPILIALAMILVFTAVNLVGVESAGRAQLYMTLTMIAFLVIYAVGVGVCVQPSNFSPFMPYGEFSVISAIAIIFPCFMGYEVVTTLSEEIKIAGRNVPRAVLLSSFLSGIFFVILTAVTVGAVRYDQLDVPAPLTFVATKCMGYFGLALISLAAALACLSSLNIAIAASGRICYAMSRDGYLPAPLSRISKRTGCPIYAILLSSFLMILFTATGSVSFVVYMTSFSYLIGLMFVALSVIELHRKLRYKFRPFRAPLHPLIPVLTIALCAMVATTIEPLSLIVGALLIIMGLVLNWYGERYGWGYIFEYLRERIRKRKEEEFVFRP